MEAGLEADKGSSLEREALRDEETPEREEDLEPRDGLGVEEARDASSRESRSRRGEDGAGKVV